MKTASMVRFQSTLVILALAAGSLLTGCGDDPANGGQQTSAGAAATGDSAGAGNDGDANDSAAGNGSGATNSGGQGGGVTNTAGTAGTETTMDNVDEYNEDSFGYVDPRPADFHPLDARESALLRREEVGIVGVSNSGTLSGFGLDDAAHSFAAIGGASPGEELGGMTIFDVKAANVDEDGNDEMVAVGTKGETLVVRVVDSDAQAVFGAQDGFTLSDASYQRAWIEARDVDDDGRAEILLAAVTTSGVELRLHDDAANGFAALDTLVSVPGAEEIAVTVGNFDDDRRPEFALVMDTGADLELRVLDDVAQGYAELLKRQNTAVGLHGKPITVTGLRILSGDFDAKKLDANIPVGDAREEFAVFAHGYDGESEAGIYSVIVDDAAASFAQIPIAQNFYYNVHPDSSYRLTNAWGWQPLAADGNGDGQDELFFLMRNGTAMHWTVTHQPLGSEVDRWEAAPGFVMLTDDDDDLTSSSPAFMAAVTGRTDSQGSDVIVAIAHDGVVTPHRLTATAIASGDDYDYELNAERLPAQPMLNGRDVFVAGGDWDADSLRVRFTGSKWLQMTRPRPIAILAAPPAKDGISQNYDDSTTTYGRASASGSATTEEYGVSNKVTLSFEVSFPGLDFLSAGAEAEFERQFTRSNTTTEMVRYGTTYEGGYPEDVIVFNGALCMRYEYLILGGGDPEHVGKTMTIDVPVDARIYKWTVSYYNETLGGEGSPVGKDILTHTVGDPSSYPTPSQRNSLMGGHAAAWMSNTEGVGQTSGVTTVSIDISEENETTDTLTLHSEYGASVGAFVGAGYSQGYDETSAYSVIVSSETSFSGTVGDIPVTTDYADWFYAFGLFVYPATLSGGESVQVIQYWTEGLSPKYFE